MMDKREKMDIAQLLQIEMLNLSEMPKMNGRSIREFAKTQGYKYLRITIDDVDTGDPVMRQIYAIRKPEKLARLLQR
jgi:hypothetical protein